jgi:hypothetical protein
VDEKKKTKNKVDLSKNKPKDPLIMILTEGLAQYFEWAKPTLLPDGISSTAAHSRLRKSQAAR